LTFELTVKSSVTLGTTSTGNAASILFNTKRSQEKYPRLERPPWIKHCARRWAPAQTRFANSFLFTRHAYGHSRKREECAIPRVYEFQAEAFQPGYYDLITLNVLRARRYDSRINTYGKQQLRRVVDSIFH